MKAIVIYATTTGNTEILADSVDAGLREGGIESIAKNVNEVEIDELEDYDLIILGSSSWKGLHRDFEEFYQEMDSLPLSGKKAAAFGTGDRKSFSDEFCGAVDILDEKLLERGAEIVTESLKVDKRMGEDIDDVDRETAKEWAHNMAKAILD